MLRVFVALGKQLPKNKKFIEQTEEVARLLAKYNCTLVQGGARMGLMGVVVEEFQKYSDEIVMIVPEVYKADLEGTKSKEHYIVEGESDRMRITIHTCDMMIVLPGGSGTLAELAYYNETCKSGEHSSKIVMLNIDGFYNKLFKFVKHQVKNGFMKKEDFKYDIINDAKLLEPIIRELIAKKQQKLQKERLEQSKIEMEQQMVKATAKTVKKLPAKSAKTTKKEQPKKSTTKKVNDSKMKESVVTKTPKKQNKSVVTKSAVKTKQEAKVEPVKKTKSTKETKTEIEKSTKQKSATKKQSVKSSKAVKKTDKKPVKAKSTTKKVATKSSKK